MSEKTPENNPCFSDTMRRCVFALFPYVNETHSIDIKNSDLSKAQAPGTWAHLNQPISSLTCVFGRAELCAVKYFRNSTFVV